jgi:Kef-type K+ transport system membrane component KefB
MAEINILFSISVILFLSPFLSRYLRIPTPSIEIVLGALLAYYGLISDFYLFEMIAHVGFFYLMFMAGTEVDLKIFIKADKAILKKAVIYLIFLYILATFSVLYFDLHEILIIIAPTLSVGLILALYKDYGKNAPWLNLSMFVGTIGELVSISLLTFAGAALEFGIGFELYKAVAYLTLLLGGMIVIFKFFHVIFWWYPGLKTYLMPYVDKEEQDLRLSMALFFLMIGIMLVLHLEVAFGAFLAGIFIATFFEHKEDLPHKISSFGFGFLVPIFFIYIGSTFKVANLFQEGVLQTSFLIVAIMLFSRVFSSFVFYKNLDKFDILRFALSQSMPLTLMIAIATIAFRSNSIDALLYSALLLSAIFEVIIGMIGIKVITFLQSNIRKLN